jgi:hypothetical protein
MIKKPRERGGHSPRWAAEPEKKIKRISTGSAIDSVLTDQFNSKFFHTYSSIHPFIDHSHHIISAIYSV